MGCRVGPSGRVIGGRGVRPWRVYRVWVAVAVQEGRSMRSNSAAVVGEHRRRPPGSLGVGVYGEERQVVVRLGGPRVG